MQLAARYQADADGRTVSEMRAEYQVPLPSLSVTATATQSSYGSLAFKQPGRTIDTAYRGHFVVYRGFFLDQSPTSNFKQCLFDSMGLLGTLRL